MTAKANIRSGVLAAAPQLTIAVNQHFGVGMGGMKDMSLILQPAPQLEVIVDLAVKHDADVLGRIPHWLHAAIQINNR